MLLIALWLQPLLFYSSLSPRFRIRSATYFSIIGSAFSPTYSCSEISFPSVLAISFALLLWPDFPSGFCQEVILFPFRQCLVLIRPNPVHDNNCTDVGISLRFQDFCKFWIFISSVLQMLQSPFFWLFFFAIISSKFSTEKKLSHFLMNLPHKYVIY